MWIKFANLCRKNDRMALAEKTINSLLNPERVSVVDILEVDSHSSFYSILMPRLLQMSFMHN